MRTDKILLLGDYSGNNAGHNALLYAIVHELAPLGMEIVIPSINSEVLRRSADLEKTSVRLIDVGPRHLGVKFFSPRVRQEIKESRAILFTDNLFYDTDLYHPYKCNLLALSALAPLARRHNVPLVYYNAGVGPLVTRTGLSLVRKLKDSFSLVTVRDEESQASPVWADMLKKPLVTADSGFSFPREDCDDRAVSAFFGQLGNAIGGRWLGVNLSCHLLRFLGKQGAVSKFGGKSEMVARLITLFREVQATFPFGLLFLVTHPRDLALSKRIAERLRETGPVGLLDAAEWSILKMAAAAKHCQIVIGTRYHELVWFAALGIPIVGINCGDKMTALFESLGAPDLLLEGEGCVREYAGHDICRALEDGIARLPKLQQRVEHLRARAGMGAELFRSACQI